MEDMVVLILEVSGILIVAVSADDDWPSPK